LPWLASRMFFSAKSPTMVSTAPASGPAKVEAQVLPYLV
jgi:hypothetical protein